jgi:hypothetical protein
MARLDSICLLLACSTAAAAQPSTERLMSAGGITRIEVGIGGEWLAFTGDPSGSVAAMHAGFRTELDESPVSFRMDAIALARFFSGMNSNGQPLDARHHVFGVIAGSDIEIPFGRDMSIAPMIGAGFAPFTKSTARPSGSGTLWMAGVQLRLRRLLVRQQFIGLGGAQESVPQFREFFPLTVGWRF